LQASRRVMRGCHSGAYKNPISQTIEALECEAGANVCMP
jgi:hypothetical protein